MIKVYNSLSKQIEEFKPIDEKCIRMYVCGSTVYQNIHIGNARPVIFFDVVERFFRYVGYDVQLVSNFTDIDDKIITRAKKENRTETEVAEQVITEIKATYQKLNCLPHYKNPKVTETIPEIIDFIQQLIDKKGAYIVDGDVYFDLNSIDEYGVISGQTKENLMVGARIEENEKKRQAIDFNLWKATIEGKRWESPWSKGRPGWHTECVVMIDQIFHDKIDIHGGGVDLKFPHHDNEIAQAKIAFGHQIANYWMHNGRVDMQNEKMSKSLGNVVMTDDLVDCVGYQMMRLLMLNVPYRQPLSYREELLEQVKGEFDKIKTAYLNLYHRLQIDYHITNYYTKITDQHLENINQQFIAAMSDDFNTANALSIIFALTKDINQFIRQKQYDVEGGKQRLSLLQRLLWVLGIEFIDKPLTQEEHDLITRWRQARAAKDFALADEYRVQLNEKGIAL